MNRASPSLIAFALLLLTGVGGIAAFARTLRARPAPAWIRVSSNPARTALFDDAPSPERSSPRSLPARTVEFERVETTAESDETPTRQATIDASASAETEVEPEAPADQDDGLLFGKEQREAWSALTASDSAVRLPVARTIADERGHPLRRLAFDVLEQDDPWEALRVLFVHEVSEQDPQVRSLLAAVAEELGQPGGPLTDAELQRFASAECEYFRRAATRALENRTVPARD